MKYYNNFRTMYDLICSAIRGIMAFLLLMLIVLLIFALLRTVATLDSGYKKNYITSTLFFNNFMQCYRIVLGIHEDYKKDGAHNWFVYIVFTVLLNFVVLNMLVAIFVNIQDKVLNSQSTFECKSKADILLEIANLKTVKKDEERFMRYLFIFRYTDEDLSDFEVKNKW